jgi:environmental stress-induced protein Ves
LVSGAEGNGGLQDQQRSCFWQSSPQEEPVTENSGSLSVSIVKAETIAPQAWKNGGGQTRELLAWPSSENWSLRISRADIEKDGPFSAFPGADRWFAVLQGKGVILTFADKRCTVRLDGEPLNFDGAQSPGCHLLDGPTQDLNLMSLGGGSIMKAVEPQREWHESYVIRGLYTTVEGCWYGQQAHRMLEPHSLLWAEVEDLQPWRFAPKVPGIPGVPPVAWWLGHSPVHPGVHV